MALNFELTRMPIHPMPLAYMHKYHECNPHTSKSTTHALHDYTVNVYSIILLIAAQFVLKLPTYKLVVETLPNALFTTLLSPVDLNYIIVLCSKRYSIMTSVLN